MYHLAAQAVQHLSARQWEIIGLASRGFTDAAMAVRLGISEGTIGTHWSRIRAKIGPFSRTELVAIGVRHELQDAMDVVIAERDALRKQLALAAAELTTRAASVGEDLDGLMVFDVDQTVLYANPAAHSMLGYHEGELVGRQIGDLVPARRLSEARTRFESCAEEPQVLEDVLAFALCRDGTELPIRLTRSCAPGAGSSLVVDTIRHAALPTFEDIGEIAIPTEAPLPAR